MDVALWHRGTRRKKETATAWATFAQYRLTAGTLSATPGLRYENIQIKREDYGKTYPGHAGSNLKTRKNSSGVWIPSLGLNYRFSPSSANAFVGVHKRFAPPSSKEGTKPENSINTELGLRYRNDALYAQTAVYFNDYSNLLGADLSIAGRTGSGDPGVCLGMPRSVIGGIKTDF